MTRSIPSVLTIAALLCAFALPALAADLARYSNPRFGITGLVPADFIAQPEPANGDGRQFVSPDGQADIAIYGSYDAMGPVPEYRAYLTAYYAGNGQVTYQTGGADWFVLSGYSGGRIFYLRVEQARNCLGELVYAHMAVTYTDRARPRIDPLVGALAKGLGMAPC